MWLPHPICIEVFVSPSISVISFSSLQTRRVDNVYVSTLFIASDSPYWHQHLLHCRPIVNIYSITRKLRDLGSCKKSKFSRIWFIIFSIYMLNEDIINIWNGVFEIWLKQISFATILKFELWNAHIFIKSYYL